MTRINLLLFLYLFLFGCSNAPTKRHEMSYAPVTPILQSRPIATNGSLFSEGRSGYYEDQRARYIGDMLTINLAERTSAKKQAKSNTSKANAMAMGTAAPTFLGRPIADFSTSVDSSSSFQGTGDSSQSNSLTGDITVTVVEVLHNNNLRVRGEKYITINQGEEVVRFSGIVRPADISQDNTVNSTQVADTRITYSGAGHVSEASKSGWVYRVFDGDFWPF